jgi:hypothetical protein
MLKLDGCRCAQVLGHCRATAEQDEHCLGYVVREDVVGAQFHNVETTTAECVEQAFRIDMLQEAMQVGQLAQSIELVDIRPLSRLTNLGVELQRIRTAHALE